jgi:hypothetical protein
MLIEVLERRAVRGAGVGVDFRKPIDANLEKKPFDFGGMYVDMSNAYIAFLIATISSISWKQKTNFNGSKS